MDYRYLPEHLRPVADSAARFLKEQRGLTKFKVEAEAYKLLAFRPTLSTTTPEGHIVCIEVLEEPFSTNLQAVVLECVRLGLPVKLYVACPTKSEEGQVAFDAAVKQARKYNLGILRVEGRDIEVLAEPQSLSFLATRQIDKKG